MKGLREKRKTILLIVALVLFFHTALFADSTYSEESYVKSAYNGDHIATATNSGSKGIEVSLNSFGSMSVMIMLILTSLVGAFFVRDEFSDVLD